MIIDYHKRFKLRISKWDDTSRVFSWFLFQSVVVHRRLPYLLGERLNELSHIFPHFLHQIHGSADAPTDVDSALVGILGTSDVCLRGMLRLKLQNWPSKALVIFVSTSLIQVSAYTGMPARFTFHFSEGLQERSILPFLCSASERIPEGMEAVRMGNIGPNELEQKHNGNAFSM